MKIYIFKTTKIEPLYFFPILMILFGFSEHCIATDLIFKDSFSDLKRQINDTGILSAANYPSTDSVDCISNISANQDCHQGRDSLFNDDTDGKAGFSFVKLDVTGAILTANATDWKCVKDKVTGLTWEVKNLITTDVHYFETNYRWGGVTHLGTDAGNHYTDWDLLVNNSNNQSFCGKTNWRVPTAVELIGLVDYSKYGFAIDLDYFPLTNSTVYWTSEPSNNGSTGDNQQGARMVDFESGALYDFAFREGTLPVRLVSGGL